MGCDIAAYRRWIGGQNDNLARGGLTLAVSAQLAGTLKGIGAPYLAKEVLEQHPLAPSNRIFLPLAVRHVGLVTDSRWEQWEAETQYYPTPAAQSELQVADILRKQHAPLPPVMPSLLSHNPRPYRASEFEDYQKRKAEWEAAAPARLAEAQRIIEKDRAYAESWQAGVSANAEGVAAIMTAYNTLATAILDNRIAAFFRPEKGGPLHQLNPSILTEAGVAESAVRRGIYARDGANFHLFVDKEALEIHFCQKPDLSALAGLSVESLSPYLQLAIVIALEQDITDTNHGNVDALQAAILEKAGGFGLTVGSKQSDDLSKDLAKSLAKAIRWPAARAGRGA